MKLRTLLVLIVAVGVYAVQNLYVRPHMARNGLYNDARWVTLEILVHLTWSGGLFLALTWHRQDKGCTGRP
jgi:hypothetical protein